MTIHTSLYVYYALALFFLFFVGRKVKLYRHWAAEAKRLNCQKPPFYKTSLPLGIDFLIRLFRSSRIGATPEFFREASEQMVKSYTFTVNILGEDDFVTADPVNIKALLATQFDDFSIGDVRRAAMGPILSGGIFVSDGKAWEHSRAMLRPQFARTQISNLELEETHVRNLMQALPIDRGTSWTEKVDLQTLFFRLTLDSAAEFLFGSKLNFQQQANPLVKKDASSALDILTDEARLAKAFDTVSAWLDTRLNLGPYYWLGDSSSFRSACKDIHNFTDKFIQRALATSTSEAKVAHARSEISKKEFNLLEALVKDTRDPADLRAQLLGILMAGRDTTAAFLGWIFYLLARHPEIYDKLRTQILQDFGSYENPKDITFEGLKNCRYLQQVMSETHRIYPVVPFNVRNTERDTTLPVGGGPDGSHPIYIRAGQQVVLNLYTLYRRKDIWGPDADEFRPERWNSTKMRWEFIPFSAGPRVCIGQQFALTEAGYVVVRMLQRFERMENLDPTPVQHRLSLIDCSGAGVVVRLKLASDVDIPHD